MLFVLNYKTDSASRAEVHNMLTALMLNTSYLPAVYTTVLQP